MFSFVVAGSTALHEHGFGSYHEGELTTKALRDLLDPLRTPGALGVNDDNFAFGAASVLGELCDDCHGVRELGLATSCKSVSFRRSCRRTRYQERLLNSPYTSLMLHDWKPSANMESHCLLPVEIRKQRLRS